LSERFATYFADNMRREIAYQNGETCARSDLIVPVDDPGFVLGITVSERLRTFRGRVFRWEQHLNRLDRSLQIMRLESPLARDRMMEIGDHLVAENLQSQPADSDLGVCLLIAPASLGMAERRSRLTMFTYELPFTASARLYLQGQRLAITPFRQVPAEVWPPELKCRSRMHYYLADRAAAQHSNDTRALLLDLDGNVSEASTANVVIYSEQRGLESPRLESILPGISLATLVELAQSKSIPVTFRDLSPDDIKAADEVMLCSTSPCVFPVSSVDGQAIGEGRPGPVFASLIEAWSEMVGMDIVKQARDLAE